MSVHTLEMCTGDAFPEQSLVLPVYIILGAVNKWYRSVIVGYVKWFKDYCTSHEKLKSQDIIVHHFLTSPFKTIHL